MKRVTSSVEFDSSEIKQCLKVNATYERDKRTRKKLFRKSESAEVKGGGETRANPE